MEAEPTVAGVGVGVEADVDVDVERLSHDLQQFQEFLDGLPDAIIDIELRTNRVTAINHMTTIVMGYTKDDVVAGMSAFVLATPEEALRVAEVSRGYITRGMEAGNGRYVRNNAYDTHEVQFLKKDRTPFDAEIQAAYILDVNDRPITMRVIVRDISERKAAQRAHEALIRELQQALDEVRTLRGLIPICAWCHSIRDDAGYWQQLETFITSHSEAEFTHGICEPCAARVEGEARTA